MSIANREYCYLHFVQSALGKLILIQSDLICVYVIHYHPYMAVSHQIQTFLVAIACIWSHLTSALSLPVFHSHSMMHLSGAAFSDFIPLFSSAWEVTLSLSETLIVIIIIILTLGISDPEGLKRLSYAKKLSCGKHCIKLLNQNSELLKQTASIPVIVIFAQRMSLKRNLATRFNRNS